MVASISRAEFARRRRALMRIMGDDAIAIVPTAPMRCRSKDIYYFYRANSDFFYLTGFSEPEAVAVLVPGRAKAVFVLFVQPRDRVRETWEGERAGPLGAKHRYDAGEAYPISQLDRILPRLMESRSEVYFSLGYCSEWDQRVSGWINGLRRAQGRDGRHPPRELVALDDLMHELRLRKSHSQVALGSRADARSCQHRRTRSPARHAFLPPGAR